MTIPEPEDRPSVRKMAAKIQEVNNDYATINFYCGVTLRDTLKKLFTRLQL